MEKSCPPPIRVIFTERSYEKKLIRFPEPTGVIIRFWETAHLPLP